MNSPRRIFSRTECGIAGIVLIRSWFGRVRHGGGGGIELFMRFANKEYNSPTASATAEAICCSIEWVMEVESDTAQRDEDNVLTKLTLTLDDGELVKVTVEAEVEAGVDVESDE